MSRPMTTFWRPLLLGMFLLHPGADTPTSPAAESPSPRQPRNDLLEPARFIQIPGPNPILTPGSDGAWDGQIIEAADALRDLGKYYLYYHGNGGEGYQVGVATREAEPNAAAYAEVHGILEPPFAYIYHTLRYRKPWRERFKPQFPVVEDLGVQVLVLQRPFRN